MHSQESNRRPKGEHTDDFGTKCSQAELSRTDITEHSEPKDKYRRKGIETQDLKKEKRF